MKDTGIQRIAMPLLRDVLSLVGQNEGIVKGNQTSCLFGVVPCL